MLEGQSSRDHAIYAGQCVNLVLRLFLMNIMTPFATRRSHPRRLSPDAPHAVVIGSGFGGLAAAVRLGARGYRVTVLEKLDAPGGRAYVYRQDGFTFDAGPTIVTAPFLLEELWQLCGRRLDR